MHEGGIHRLIVTDMKEEAGFSKGIIEARDVEITAVTEAFGFASVTRLGFSAVHLNAIPLADIIAEMGKTLKAIAPDTIYVPFPGDVHSDHRKTFEAASACCKSFRHPSVRKVIACEIPSETDFGIDPSQNLFRPDLFVDISAHLDEKIRIMETYDGEIGEPPFPRSEQAIRALATLRGGQAGCAAAEAFMVLKEIR